MNTKITNMATLSLNANNLSVNLPVNGNETQAWLKWRWKQILAWWWSGNDDPQGNIVFKIEKMLNRKNENGSRTGDGHFVF